MPDNQEHRATPRDFFFALRPSQWTKNLVVPAAFFFAFWDKSHSHAPGLDELFVVIPAMILFCLVSSGIYLFNDIRDIEADRIHPTKMYRPVAAGRISIAQAWRLSILLVAAGIGGSWVLCPEFGAVTGSYVLLQVIYTLWLKRIPLVDIVIIASGFVFRAVAGAVLLEGAMISFWLLCCTFLLALFLALCKRRHERVFFQEAVADHRPGLERLSERFLDVLIATASIATVASYSAYTIWPGTVAKFGTRRLALTIPFVVLGMLRYLYLVYLHKKGDRPEKILLTDIPLFVILGLYAATVIAVFMLSR